MKMKSSPSCKAKKVESFANAIMPGTVLQHLQITGSKWGLIITLFHKMTSSYVLHVTSVHSNALTTKSSSLIKAVSSFRIASYQYKYYQTMCWVWLCMHGRLDIGCIPVISNIAVQPRQLSRVLKTKATSNYYQNVDLYVFCNSRLKG